MSRKQMEVNLHYEVKLHYTVTRVAPGEMDTELTFVECGDREVSFEELDQAVPEEDQSKPPNDNHSLGGTKK